RPGAAAARRAVRLDRRADPRGHAGRAPAGLHGPQRDRAVRHPRHHRGGLPGRPGVRVQPAPRTHRPGDRGAVRAPARAAAAPVPRVPGAGRRDRGGALRRPRARGRGGPLMAPEVSTHPTVTATPPRAPRASTPTRRPARRRRLEPKYVYGTAAVVVVIALWQ